MPLTKNDPAQLLRQFHRKGVRPSGADGPDGMVPPHLSDARAAIGKEYPACIVQEAGSLHVMPVSELLNNAIEGLGLSEDDEYRCRKAARRLEEEIEENAVEDGSATLSDLWGSAAISMIADVELPGYDRESVRQDLSRIRAQVDADGPVIPFHEAAPLQLLYRVAAARDEEAPVPGKVRDAVRQALRIEGEGPLLLRGISVQKAQEAVALYRDTVLDETSPDEREALPPLLIQIPAGGMEASQAEDLLALLSTSLPVKVLVTLDELVERADATAALRAAGWRTRLAERAVSSTRAFVLQAAASQAKLMAEVFSDALASNVPALLTIYTGGGLHSADPARAAAAAVASRVFPSFIHDPTRGAGIVERFRLAGNPEQRSRWASIATGEGGQAALTAADFFALDSRLSDHFMVVPENANTQRLMAVADFVEASAAERSTSIAFVELADVNGRTRRVACSPAVAHATDTTAAWWRNLQELGGIDNTIAQRAVAEERARLQESFEQEKEEIARRHEEEIEEAQRELAPKIVSNIAAGMLGLSENDVSLSAPPPPAEARTEVQEKEASVEAEPATAEVEEEDEGLAFDEPYIDTDECTTCDECLMTNDNIFAYNENDKAYIKDPRGGPYRDIVVAAERCPAEIIHPGKPLDPDEPGLEELVKRAEPYQ